MAAGRGFSGTQCTPGAGVRRPGASALRRAVLLVFLSCLAAGALAGCLLALWGGAGEDARWLVPAYMERMASGAGRAGAKMPVFYDSAFKYGAFALLLWLTAFFRRGTLFASLLLFFKAAVYGFAFSALIGVYGPRGVPTALSLFGAQSVLLTLSALYVAYRGACRAFRGPAPPVRRSGPESGLVDYVMALILAGACAILAAFLDAFFTVWAAFPSP